MIIKFHELYEFLPKLGWEKKTIELGKNGHIKREILKHPEKLLYLDKSGFLGKNYRIYRLCHIDIINRVFSFPLYKSLDFNDATGLVIIEDLIAVKLI